MKNKRFFRLVLDAINDFNRPIIERVFLVLTIITEFAVSIAFIADIVTKENSYEIIVLIGALVFVPAIVFWSLKKDKIQLAIKITVLFLVFVILPALFFLGGGVEGGGILWVIFTFAYMGLVLTGAWRRVMITLLFLFTLGFFVIEYFYPDIVYKHERGMFYIDSFVSLVLVGIVCFVMTRVQNKMFIEENKRAKAAADKAEELTRAQNRFFSSMSHEIRTPINSILGLNELILRDQSASDEIARDASGIQGSGKMLLALINDILDFSKMEAGSMDIVPVDYRIGDMLSEIVNMIWLKASDKGLKLNVTIDPKVPSVLYGDEVRIKQIIVNLLNNAVKYTQEGSVELHVESTERDEKTVELSISISDTGIGIKKESLPYLFDAFKRVDEEKNRHIEGTGLGLSIVKQLVDLMGGSINVNSIYGEGSTFTVTVLQGISDHAQIGELNIHSQGSVRHKAYESSFRAPSAKILIVDDNVMNLEVESKLLADTEMSIDKAISGKEALEFALKNRYDAILMDHLMPEMDGIECLEKLRNQEGGFNRTSPVIVLTANAGSENRELYNRSGFDGYLVKPVSGETLENVLMRFLPQEKLVVNTNKMMTMREDINAAEGYSGKLPIVVTSTSMCDLPVSIIRKLYIPILPFHIRTEEGLFKDGLQMGADELVRYLLSGKNATSSPPDESAYMDFFAKELRRAHHIIHIAITSDMSEDYKMAMEAAKSFDNVTVINSECLSSATGILVLIAHKLAQMNDNVEEIVAELEEVKKRLQCSFVIDTTEYMAKKGLIGSNVDRIAKSLNLHPCIRIKDDRSGIGGIWMGNRKRAYKKYIAKAFPVDVIPDPEIVFITYIGVPIETLLWIKAEVSKLAYFEHVVFRQASAAISANCGPGSFGILYFIKSNKSYNLASYFDQYKSGFEDNADSEDVIEEQEFDDEPATDEAGKVEIEDYSGDELVFGKKKASKDSVAFGQAPKEVVWYEGIEGIDRDIAIKNSGSEDAFKTVLKIFYDSIEDKAKEIDGYYSSEDWKDYTIKVHALKSSSKLIGAMQTAEKAQLLETAGKEDNIAYIKENHEAFMEEYRSYKAALSKIFEKESDKDADAGKPVADQYLMSSVYEGMLDAAQAMDCAALDEILKEIEGYAIPEGEKEKFESLCNCAGQFDYDGIIAILSDEEQ